MATQTGHKIKKHIALSREIVEHLEAAAQEGHVSLSEVIEAYVRDRQQAHGQAPSALEGRLDQMATDLADLRAKVLPLVATVTAMLRQMEGELPVKLDAEASTPLPRIVPYEEIYAANPSTPVSETPHVPERTEDLPKLPKRWRLSLW